ncbi:MAG: MarR family transcriptional regulator [Actinomycetota bacterium]|nr:MarR family transcriptional regulator [Actinomycetota bacterium]
MAKDGETLVTQTGKTAMSKKKDLEMAEEFLSSARDAIKSLKLLFREELKEFGISWTQFHLLKLVKRTGGINVTQISRCMMSTPATSSKMIDLLSAKGLLEKQRSESDRRICRLVLTEESEKLLEAATEKRNRIMAEILEGESEKDLRAIIQYLERIRDKCENRVAMGKEREGELREKHQGYRVPPL